jgi:hypothetical protein
MSATLSQYMPYLFFEFAIEYGVGGTFVDLSKGTCLRAHN